MQHYAEFHTVYPSLSVLIFVSLLLCLMLFVFLQPRPIEFLVPGVEQTKQYISSRKSSSARLKGKLQ